MVRYRHRHNAHAAVEESEKIAEKQWIHVVSPTDIEIEQLAADLQLDASLLRDATDPDEMPRFDSDDHNSYIFARFAYRMSNNHINTAPILFIVTEHNLVTVTNREFDELDEMLDKQAHLTTNSPKHLVLPALNKCLQSYSSYLASIGRQIRTARNSLRDEKFSNRHFVKFVEIEDILNDFLSELVPINNIMLHLLAGRKIIKFTDTDRDVLQDLQLENAQLIDESKGYLKTIVNIREAYSNIMTNNLNRQIKILTTLTIVLTVPTIVGSFFGMNVAGIPFANNSSAFILVFGITMAIAIGILAFLKSKDWL